MSSQPDAISMRFWGVRGSIPTPGPTTLQYGGNTSCIELRAGDQIIILDAGTGLRLLGLQLMSEFGEKPLELTLLLTHTHWDHIQGLPFFLPVYQPNNHLRILGYEGARVGLETVLNSQMESPFFPIGLKEVPANIRIEELKDWEFELGGVHVRACYAHHPGSCVGYRLSFEGRSIAFFPDNELNDERSGPLAGQRATSGTPSAMLKGQCKLSDFVQGVDVLVMDSQYDATEYERHIGWGHGCVDRVVSLAVEAQVKQLYLFHHDPNHDDTKITEMVSHARKLAAAQGSNLLVEAAREGLTVNLP
jgi:phosphoribosyl 1,2-cyclic phosphodiesterase